MKSSHLLALLLTATTASCGVSSEMGQVKSDKKSASNSTLDRLIHWRVRGAEKALAQSYKVEYAKPKCMSENGIIVPSINNLKR